MEYLWLVVVLLLGALGIFGIYLTITTVANKVFEKSKWEIRSKNIEITLPLRLQAYERMSIFLERITPNNLLLRVVPAVSSALELQQVLLQEIRDEYNHNVAQQLYMSPHAWEQLTGAMNETVAIINQASLEISPDAPPADLAKKIFSAVIAQEKQPVSHAMQVLKEEIRTLF